MSEIGKIKPIMREIHLNADGKRFWLGKIESTDNNTCNESVPISLNYFESKNLMSIGREILKEFNLVTALFLAVWRT